MLTFQKSALDYARQDGRPVYLEMSPIISGCCLTIRESPSVRFGEPLQPQLYDKTCVDGITVYIPHELPDIPLEIVLASFFGFKKLAIEGWRLA